MLNTNTGVQKFESTEVRIKALKETNPTSRLNDYIEDIKAKDIEKIESYLGVLYFLVLTFLSITLLM